MANSSTRDGFTSKWGFILACIGSAVGMGNIWRFPILVSKFGGLTFLLPYFIFVVLVGASGVMEEFALGRAAGAGPVGACGMCMEVAGKNRKTGELIGMIPIIGSMGLSIGYTVVFSWICKYLMLAITGQLTAMGQDMELIGGTFGATASAWGNNLWIIIAIVVSFIIMSMGIAKGIEAANKVMMPVLFGLFLILGIYIAFLPGSSEGYKYILSFNQPYDVVDDARVNISFIKVLVYAFGQAFFSLSVGGNGSVIYGSYLSKDESIPSSAKNVALFDTIAALLAAFVILPAMAAGGVECNSSGPGLMFIYLVNVINGMPGARIIGIVFFVAVFFAGLSSIINLYEAPSALLQEKFNMKRVPAVGIIVAIGCVVAICIQAITSEWMDVVSIYICPIGAFITAFMFFWIAGKKFAEDQVSLGSEKRIGSWFYPLGKYVFCGLSILALILGAAWGGIG